MCNIHIYIYIYTYKTYTLIYVYIYIHTDICIHTYIQTYTRLAHGHEERARAGVVDGRPVHAPGMSGWSYIYISHT